MHILPLLLQSPTFALNSEQSIFIFRVEELNNRAKNIEDETCSQWPNKKTFKARLLIQLSAVFYNNIYNLICFMYLKLGLRCFNATVNYRLWHSIHFQHD